VGAIRIVLSDNTRASRFDAVDGVGDSQNSIKASLLPASPPV
jgi:hypothetical protein